MKELSPTVAESATGNKQINLLPTAAAAANLERFKEPTFFSLYFSDIFFSFSSIEKQQIALLRRLQSSSRKINSRKNEIKRELKRNKRNTSGKIKANYAWYFNGDHEKSTTGARLTYADSI